MATEAGIGANNAMFVCIESVYGTYEDPGTGTGVWVPILSENLVYTEQKYYSEQIRQQAMDSSVNQSYYHVEGDIVMEVDANYLPYFLYASRHTVTKTGSVAPYAYAAVPSNIGSTYPGGSAKGLSITVIRNGEGFGYGGCVVNQYAFTVENGVLRVTLSMLGLSEQLPSDLGSTSWLAPSLLGADAHAVYIDTAGASPSFASADVTHNGFTGTINHNAAPQNRIVRDRAATFVSYGKSELSYETQLDFLDRTEYDDFVAATRRAFRFESTKPSGAWGSATEGFRMTFFNSAYDAYTVETPAIGDLVSAQVTGHGLSQTGGSGYKLECLSPTNIT